MKVFLSWSKRPSEDYAKIIYEYLPLIINVTEKDVFMSTESIDLGTNGILKITENLADSGFGLLFMTPNNKNQTWLNFEAGAISKGLTKNRVTPLVFDVKDKSTVLDGGPISSLQGTLFSKESFLKIILAMDRELPEHKQKGEDLVKKTFENSWPTIQGKIAGISGSGYDGKPWYSKEESYPDPIETKINRIHDILEKKSISAQETYNEHQVVNLHFNSMNQVDFEFSKLYVENKEKLLKENDYFYSNEFYTKIHNSFFNPLKINGVNNTLNNVYCLLNMFKIYFFTKQKEEREKPENYFSNTAGKKSIVPPENQIPN